MSNKSFLDLELKPVYLHEGLFTEILDVVNKYSYRCDLRKIPCVSCWDLDRKKDVDNYLSSIQK